MLPNIIFGTYSTYGLVYAPKLILANYVQPYASDTKYYTYSFIALKCFSKFEILTGGGAKNIQFWSNYILTLTFLVFCKAKRYLSISYRS